MTWQIQKKLAGQILKCSKKRVWFDPTSLDEIKEAITKVDVRSLINKGIIKRKSIKGVSKARARKRKEQRRKGRQKGDGSKKGKRTARLPKKSAWIGKIRIQRKFLKTLRDAKLIDPKIYRELYRKSSGGFFRSKRHIKLYIDEHELIKNEN
jgi:large subunit ribosomal protein L19e